MCYNSVINISNEPRKHRAVHEHTRHRHGHGTIQAGRHMIFHEVGDHMLGARILNNVNFFIFFNSVESFLKFL